MVINAICSEFVVQFEVRLDPGSVFSVFVQQYPGLLGSPYVWRWSAAFSVISPPSAGHSEANNGGESGDVCHTRRESGFLIC